MKEEKIIERNNKKLDKICSISLISALFAWYFSFSVLSKRATGLGIYLIPIVLSIVAFFAYFYYFITAKELVVTNKGVYGKTVFGKQVDLPFDSISSVGTNVFRGISVGTSSGKISFYGIVNRNEIYDEIRKMLENRQEKEIKAIAPTTNILQGQSIADELKKFKDLLDSGVITQEEFDAKKKQLLGL